MRRILLNGAWDGKCYEGDGGSFSFQGTVPGCVHTDLRGDRIPHDLYYRDHADACAWIEDCDFEYSRSFTIESVPPSATLVFEGLDVYADVYLNRKKLGSTENMFISHRFDLTGLLKEGENELSVYFGSPIRRVQGLAPCTGAFTRERMHTRRMQCTYGWDWVARFVTVGICRDVYIDCNDGFGVKDAYVYTDGIGENYASVVVEAEFERYEEGGYADFVLLSPDGEIIRSNRYFVKEDVLKVHFDIPDARLWYPVGYGEQPLYKLLICGKEFAFGIRVAKVIELPDKKGDPYYEKCLALKDSVSARRYDRNEDFSGFCLLINGLPILCHGANWVPCEPFVSEESDGKITKLLELAAEAGVNMLRVWGGGVFEKQHFYSECDRLGLLVTQDFLMACGHYPEDNPDFIDEVRRETEFAAHSLRNHPSLVWWSGDNENAVEGYDEAQTYPGRRVIHEAIEPVLRRLDPQRRFFLSSPYGGTPYASKTKGTTHNTQYLGCSIFPYILKQDMQDYKEHFSQYLARFVAEEPSLGAICLPSLRRFMTDEDIFSSDEMWDYHMKGNPALSFTLLDVLRNFTEKVLGSFTDGADRFFKLKYAQYEWVRITMENLRRNAGFSNGLIYWMWNDCWPASAGWALVDYYCLPKASFYSFKRCAKPIVSSIDLVGDELCVYLCSKALADAAVSVTVSYLLGDTLTELYKLDAIACAGGATQTLAIPEKELPASAILVCEIKGEGVCDRSFYKRGDLKIEPSDAFTVISRTEDSITVCANKYIHALELEGEQIYEDNYFSLLPGESRRISFSRVSDAASDEIAVKAYTICEK